MVEWRQGAAMVLVVAVWCLWRFLPGGTFYYVGHSVIRNLWLQRYSLYRRPYFLVDVVAGAGFGIICAALAHIVALKLPWKVLDSRALELFKK